MKIYLIAGLGTDKRIFNNINLPQIYEPVHLEWIEPYLTESIEQYARRLAAYIDDKQDFILLGLSLGGMIASEINKIIQPKKTIIISGAATSQQLPLWIRLAGKLKLQKAAPYLVNKNRNRFIAAFIGAHSDEDRKMLADMRKDSSRRFSIWALKAVASWKNNQEPGNLVYIHGDKDRLLSCPKGNGAIIISGGTHFMVYNRAADINKALRQIL